MANLPGWDKYIEITLDGDKIDAVLTNFAFPLLLSTSSGITDTDVSCVFDEIGASYLKMAVTVHSVSDSTECYVEVEKWDNSGESALIHIKAASLPATGDPVVRIYYDSAHADNTTYIGLTTSAVAQNVWNSETEGCWTMAQDPNGDASNSLKDSTSNAYNGTPGGSMTTADLIDAPLGKAIDFDGTDDKMSLGTSIGTALGNGCTDIQVDVYFKADTVTSDDSLLSFTNLGTTQGEFSCLVNSSKLHLRLHQSFLINGTFTDTSGWNYVSYRYDGVNGKIYLNGTQLATGATASGLTLSGINLYFSQYYQSNYGMFDGAIGHVRVYNAAQSEAWTEASAAAFLDTFGTFSGEQSTVTYAVSGNVKENSTNVARSVWLTREDTGVRVDTTTSDGGTGNYSFTALQYQGPYNVKAIDDASGLDYNDLIFAGVMGVAE